jgi:hypothetical protein
MVAHPATSATIATNTIRFIVPARSSSLPVTRDSMGAEHIRVTPSAPSLLSPPRSPLPNLQLNTLISNAFRIREPSMGSLLMIVRPKNVTGAKVQTSGYTSLEGLWWV